MDIDNFDKSILRQLQQNSRLSTQALGDIVGLSATACQRRLKKLRASSIIEKEVAVLNTSIASDNVTIVVEVIMKQGSSIYIKNFKKRVDSNPNIQQCFYVTGAVDFILIICVNNMQQFEQLTKTLLLDDDNIVKFNSTVVMDTVKKGLSIPLT